MDDTTPAVSTPSASDHIGHYRIERIIGRGAVEIRCLATDTRRQREVILEVLPLTLSRRPEVLERLGHLADVVRQIRHRGLVRLVRFEIDPDRPDLAYFVWQHVPGSTLAELIDQSDGGLPIERVGAWASQLAEAIDHLEEHGPGHGGVRPENIIINEHDEARLCGAVVWREMRRLHAKGATKSGSDRDAEVRSVEQSPRRDVRDLAATVYAALCGVDVEQACAGRPQPIAGLSAQLNMALIAALEDATAEQFTRAEDLVRSLEGAPLREMLIPSRPPARRSATPLLTGVAVMALALSAVTWILTLMPAVPATTMLAGIRHAASSPIVSRTSPRPRAEPLAAALARPERPLTRVIGTDRPPSPNLVSEAELNDAARRAAETRRRAGRLNLRRPGVESGLRLASARLEQGRELHRSGRHADALAEYELATDAYTQAVMDDALAATVVRFGHRLRTEIDTARDQADGRLDAVIGTVAELIDAGGEAYRRGDVAEANLSWQEAEQMLRSVRSLGELIDAATLASERWRSAAGRTPQPWWTPLRSQAEDAIDRANGARDRFEVGAYEEAIAGWEAAARTLERLLDMQRLAECETDELAEAWLVASSTTSFDTVDLDEIETLHRKALETAEQARRARDCGELDSARFGYAAAAALWQEAAETRRVAAAHRGEPVVNSLGQRLAFVAGGVFVMGSPPSEPGRDASERRRRIDLANGVWIATTEVTRAQFAAFVDATGHRTDAERRGWSHGLRPDGRWRRVNGLSWRNPGFDQTEDHPVVCVSYSDAMAFCDWLSQREGRRYRLPGEVEWEYACRAGATTAFFWGDEPGGGAGFENAADASWSSQFEKAEGFPWSDGCLYTCPVGSLAANAWGLHDMHGNVQEWCLDSYATYAAAETATPTTETLGIDGDSPRVIRGGSFAAPPRRCRAAHRDASTPATSFATLGFRVVAEPARRAAR